MCLGANPAKPHHQAQPENGTMQRKGIGESNGKDPLGEEKVALTNYNHHTGMSSSEHLPMDAEPTLASMTNRLLRIELLLHANNNSKSNIPANAQWRMVATALDRLFLLFFMMITITTIVLFFPRP